MPDLEQNQDSDFMREKIKERPVNKRKLLKRTILSASMAVVFGLIACLTFLILEPVFNNWLYPEEKPPKVEFPEEIEEILPEDMLVQDVPPEKEPVNEEISLEEEQIQEILSGIKWSVQDLRALYSSLSTYVSEISKSMVTITGAVSNMDWFSEVYESEGITNGVIFYNNADKELLILADRAAIVKAESITVTFHDGTEVPAEVKQFDSNTGLAVISVAMSDLTDTLKTSLLVAPLGASNGRGVQGSLVVVLGSPFGTPGGVCYGNVVSSSSTIYLSDANYKLIQTDIFGSESANGIIFDLQGQILGVVTNGQNSTDLKNQIVGYGISELKKTVEKLADGKAIAYMGIAGTDVTKEANEELEVPFGAYVKDIFMDTPALKAGIQRGDVIVAIGDTPIETYSDYTVALLELEPDSTVEVKVMRKGQGEYKEMTFEVHVTTSSN